MKCFFLSNPERKHSDGRHRGFPLRCRSHGSMPETKQSAPQTKSLTELDPSSIQSNSESPTPNLSQSSSRGPLCLRRFSYSELRAATRNFSRANLLGEGGFGCVFKGLIRHQDPSVGEVLKEVAVKQLNKKGKQGHKEWLAEVRFLGLVEHPNLVKLVGYCGEDDERGMERLLVYEYMANRSLEDHIFKDGFLSWQERLHVLLGAACGLTYLHEEMNDIQVIFRDFKTSNVLLDKDFTPKLSDFGLAREGPSVGNTHVSTVVVGTMGYAAPEYVQTGHLTAKSDVWSFGVVILEMLAGRRSMDRNRPKGEQQLLDWVKPYLHGNRHIHKIMDPRLEGKYSLLQAQKLASLAQQCLAKHPRGRPIMSVVVEELKEIVALRDISSELSNLEYTSLSTSSKDILHADETKESVNTKRRRVLIKEAMKLRNREDTWFWRIWAPKVVQA